MRNGRGISIPPADDDDFEDVHWALTAASTLWERGEDSEALKWLRRAASAAADRDADVRAVELFKAAADVASVLEAAEPPTTRPSQPAPAAAPSTEGVPPRRGASGLAVSDGPNDGDRRTPPPLPPRPTRRGTPPAPTRRAAPSTVVPAVPPEPRVSDKPTAARPEDDSEQDTFILPETQLRRALTHIDPAYPDRVDYQPGEQGDDEEDLGTASLPSVPGGEGPPRPSGAVSREGWDDEDDEEDQDTQVETQRRAKPATAQKKRRTLVPIGVLPALRVAVLHIPEEGDVRLLFLPPGATPPPGVATALLVAPSQRDAELLTEVYAKCDAKL
ncbi:MAG: hypothetical protein JRI68_05840 [Deltaproteobacteria bacterium]|nr:hypothetical protein [Deltaproteobacteria bacterium]